MELTIEEKPDGQFEVIRLMPSTLGTFPDRDVAEKFMVFMTEDALDEVPGETRALPAPISDPVPASPHVTTLSKTPTAVAKPPAPDAWTEQELSAAYERLRAGDKLKDVAAAAGKSWTILRAKWASLKTRAQSGNDAETPAPSPTPSSLPAVIPDPELSLAAKVTTAIEELNAQPECIGCGKRFTASVENWENCARCSRVA